MSEARGLSVPEALEAYSYYHILEVAPGVFTPGIPDYVPVQEVVKEAIRSIPIAGRRVLDIGCRDGLFSFLAEEMGAAEVIGIDNDLSPAAVEFLIPHFESQVRMVEMNVNDLGPDAFGLFDVVLFPGVLYHLRYPFWALKKVVSVLAPGGHLILETGILDALDDYGICYCPTGSESPYEATSVTFFNVKGLTDTLLTFGVKVERINLLNGRRRRKVARLVRSKGAKLPTNRATLVCVSAPEDVPQEVAKYWDGVHGYHSHEGQ